MTDINSLQDELISRIKDSDTPESILKATELRNLFAEIPKQLPELRKEFGQRVNGVKVAVEQAVVARRIQLDHVELPAIDVTAPFDVNSARPTLLPSSQGSLHPLTQEIERVSDIFNRMGFVTEQSREIDDQYHMFETLNFPKGHPARDDYDTFMTVETDGDGEPLIAPAHTSTMQNRTLSLIHI